MSKLTESLKSAFKSLPPADPQKLAGRIAGEEALIHDLEQKHAAAALNRTAGVNGAAEAMAGLDADLEAARRNVRGLQAAHALALQHKAERERMGRAALHATQINAIAQHIAARNKAAEELATALEAAATAYKALVKRSQKAINANPVGLGAWPGGSYCELSAIKQAIAHELYRLTADGSLEQRFTFPGAAFDGLGHRQQPEKITPLVDVIKHASEHTLAVLRGRKANPGAAAAPAPAPVPATNDLLLPDHSAALEQQTVASGPKMDARGFIPTRRAIS
jgi:hypothetical protein